MHGLAPGLRVDATEGAVRFHDAQIDDARHVVALARTAVGPGAAIATGVRVIGAAPLRSATTLPRAPTRRRARQGRPAGRGQAGHGGARATTRRPGQQIVVHARVVLSAAGVWTDDLVAMATGRRSQGNVRRSKGVHLVVPRRAFRSTTAVIARTPRRVLFLLPWSEHWLVGTTDTDDTGTARAPGRHQPRTSSTCWARPTAGWLVRWCTEDVVGVYAGLRPLLAAGPGGDDRAVPRARRDAARCAGSWRSPAASTRPTG